MQGAMTQSSNQSYNWGNKEEDGILNFKEQPVELEIRPLKKRHTLAGTSISELGEP